MNDGAPIDLSGIRVLWRRPDSLCLYGLPYDLRPGQSPYDLWRGRKPTPGPCDGWIWLGSPGWWGTLSCGDQEIIAAFLKTHAENVPGGPCEWSPLYERSNG